MEDMTRSEPLTKTDPHGNRQERQEVVSKMSDNEASARPHSGSKQNINGTSCPPYASSTTSSPPTSSKELFTSQTPQYSHGLTQRYWPPPPRLIMSGNFAAVTYLANVRSFSTFHLIDVDGTVSNSGADDLMNFNNVSNLDEQEQALHDAGTFGLAAGKAYLSYNGAQAITSGFFLDGSYFVTCAHWLDTFKKQNADTWLVESYLKASFDGTRISDETNSVLPNLRKDRPAQLAQIWREDDLAIFRLKPASNRPRSSIPLDSIGHFTTHPSTILRTVWTAGYNGDDEKAIRSELPQDIQIQNTTPANPHPTAFDCLLRFKLDQVAQVHGRVNIPVVAFSQFMQPNNRAMAPGKVIGTAYPTHQGVMKEALDQGIPRSKTKDFAISVSGFWGISGAMIAMFESEDVAHSPKVVGIFAGVEDWGSQNNMMRAFTDSGVDAIKRFVAQDRSGNGLAVMLGSLHLSGQNGTSEPQSGALDQGI